MPLSLSSIIWYQSADCDTLWLSRYLYVLHRGLQTDSLATYGLKVLEREISTSLMCHPLLFMIVMEALSSEFKVLEQLSA